jgi:hypothetical protein
MSLEKNFRGLSSGFLFVFHRLFAVLYGVSGFVSAGLVCSSMLFSVEFHVGMREVRMLQRRLRKSFPFLKLVMEA